MIAYLLNLINPVEFLDDFAGKKCTKKLWGGRLLTLSCLFSILLFFATILAPVLFHKEVPQNTFDNCFDLIIITSLIGTTLAFGGDIGQRLSSFKRKK